MEREPLLVSITSPEHIEKARDIARQHNMRSEFICANILDEMPRLPDVDIVVCMAVARHLYGTIKEKYVPHFKTPSQYLIFTGLDTLIRQKNNEDRRIQREFNEVMAGIMRKARRRFICSYHDRAQLLVRRSGEVEKYFRSLDSRVNSVEVYRTSQGLNIQS